MATFLLNYQVFCFCSGLFRGGGVGREAHFLPEYRIHACSNRYIHRLQHVQPCKLFNGGMGGGGGGSFLGAKNHIFPTAGESGLVCWFVRVLQKLAYLADPLSEYIVGRGIWGLKKWTLAIYFQIITGGGGLVHGSSRTYYLTWCVRMIYHMEHTAQVSSWPLMYGPHGRLLPWRQVASTRYRRAPSASRAVRGIASGLRSTQMCSVRLWPW